MSILIDTHSHILPGIDDGSKSLEQSIAMLRMEAEQRIQRVVATPHFYPQHDSPGHFLERRAKAEEALRKEMEKYSDLPELYIGAEVYYFNRMYESDMISGLTIGDSQCILVEMPRAPWTESMYRDLENIYVKSGLVPIVAHVDRYVGRFRTFGIPERLAELPVLVQANAEFFLNGLTSAMALRMLKQDLIHLLASDCHNLDSRKPNLKSAADRIAKRLGEDTVARVNAYGQDLLNGSIVL